MFLDAGELIRRRKHRQGEMTQGVTPGGTQCVGRVGGCGTYHVSIVQYPFGVPGFGRAVLRGRGVLEVCGGATQSNHTTTITALQWNCKAAASNLKCFSRAFGCIIYVHRAN